MLDSKTFLKLIKVIFAVVGIAHLLRILMGWDMVIGGWVIPIWFSYFGVVFAWFLAYNAHILKGKRE